jgi:hypothetical protein
MGTEMGTVTTCYSLLPASAATVIKGRYLGIGSIYWSALATAPAETSAEAKVASIIAFSSSSFFSLH